MRLMFAVSAPFRVEGVPNRDLRMAGGPASVLPRVFRGDFLCAPC